MMPRIPGGNVAGYDVKMALVIHDLKNLDEICGETSRQSIMSVGTPARLPASISAVFTRSSSGCARAADLGRYRLTGSPAG